MQAGNKGKEASARGGRTSQCSPDGARRARVSAVVSRALALSSSRRREKWHPPAAAASPWRGGCWPRPPSHRKVAALERAAGAKGPRRGSVLGDIAAEETRAALAGAVGTWRGGPSSAAKPRDAAVLLGGRVGQGATSKAALVRGSSVKARGVVSVEGTVRGMGGHTDAPDAWRRAESGSGGHGNPAPAQPAAGRAPEAPDSASPEQIAMLRRLGLNRIDVIEVLKSDLVGSIDPRAPMRVAKYTVFKQLGRIPRSNDKMTSTLSEVPDDAKLGFVSHRWLRPWHTKEECEANNEEWAGMPHPDNAKGAKYKLICDGMEKLAQQKGWNIDRVYLWIDFAGVEQDNGDLLIAGVASLRGYITLCDAILVPAPARVPEGASHTVDVVPGGYGQRAWTRLEAMSMYAVSILKQVEAPEIWVAAGDGASFLERFDYVLDKLPSDGMIFDANDLDYIKAHENAFLRQIKESLKRNGYITKHKCGVNCVAFDPKDERGDLVASGGHDGVIKLVNRQTGTAVWALPTQTRVKSLAFNADGSMLAAGGEDGVVRMWAVASGSSPEQKCSLTGHSDCVNCVAWSPDGEFVASASADQKVKIWIVKTMEEVGSLTGHTAAVNSVAFSPDSKFVASGCGQAFGSDNSVRIWDVSKGEVCTVMGHSNAVFSVAWNHDGSLSAGEAGDITERLWDLKTQKHKGTLTGHSGFILSVAWSPDGEMVAFGSSDGTVRLRSKSGEHKGSLTGHSGPVESVAWNREGSLIASAGGHGDNTVRLWNVKTLEHKRTLSGHLDMVCSVAWNHDGSLIASGSRDDTVRLWNLNTGRKMGTLLGHSGDVLSLAWSPDGEMIASGSSDMCVCLWSKTGKRMGTLMGHSGPVLSVAYSPDGSQLASAGGRGDNTVRLWDPRTDEHKGTLENPHTNNPECSCNVCSWKWMQCTAGWPVKELSDRPPGKKNVPFSLKGHIASWLEIDTNTKDLIADIKENKKEGKNKGSPCLRQGVGGTDRSGQYIVTANGDTPPVVHIYRTDFVTKVKEGGCTRSYRTGQYIVTANGDMVYIYRTDMDGGKQGEPLACFRSPARVTTVSCRGTSVVVGCQDGQVLFLQAPLLAS